MSTSLFWRGIAIGFAIAAPVGPIGLLCIQRTLQQGRRVGLVSGLGAATADAFYGLIAGFGLTFISTFLIKQQTWLSLAGGVFLLSLGVRTFLKPPAEQGAGQSDVKARGGLAGAYLTTLLLTLTNPVTILSFVAVYAGLGLAAETNYGSASLLVAGVFSGSAAWWLMLSGGVSLLRDRITAGTMRWINRLAGLVIVVFGLLAIASVWNVGM